MRTVEDESGRRLLVVKRSAESWLVRDPESGAERYVDPADVTTVDDAAPLETAARALDADARRLVLAVRDDRALGLLCHLDASGPRSVRALMDETDLCESDLHGTVAEFRAAGLLEEVAVDGRRGYGLTDAGRKALDRLR
ncbi:MAG: hypothetical protein ABEJ43_07775 [Haloferacaceae archaeon]